MKDCRGELLSRVRRGLASAQEQTAFEAHLSNCESCSMTLELMGDFDDVGGPESTDWERVAALAGAAAAAHGRTAPAAFRAPRGVWRFAMAALVLTGVAAAGVAMRLTSGSPSQFDSAESADAGRVDSSVVSPASEKSVGNAVGLNAEEAPKAADAPASEPADTAPSSVPRKPAPGIAPLATSAKDTYKAANDARREGRTGEAIQGYHKLQKQFPGSPEAHASRVSLGGLLLRAGSSRAALTQFDAYLASSGGQLAAEALFGRAQALRALGRSADEAQNLDRLVKNYPQSAYATHAQRRLLELR